MNPLTPDELHAALLKTTLPTLLVEGSTDASVYRYLERKLRSRQLGFAVDILPCGGRTTLLEVFRRMNTSRKIGIRNEPPIVYLADRDMWLFANIPDEYATVIFTTGYSIENELFAGSGIERLLEQGSEDTLFRATIEQLACWFAFEVAEFRAGRPHQVDHHPLRVVSDDGGSLRATFCATRGYVPQSSTCVEEVLSNYTTHLPGKRIFEVLAQILSAKGRPAKHNRGGLQEACLKFCDQNDNLTRLLASLEQAFS